VITASALTRLKNCPSSAVLPRAENYSEWADAGHEAHEELALFSEEHPFAHLLPPSPRAEVKLAYHLASRQGRALGGGGGPPRRNPGPFEIVGSCDVLGIDRGRVVIIDWKTGWVDVDPASSNAQLWFYALAAARALGLSGAIVRIVYTQSKRCDEYEIDALELAEFASSLERLHVRVGELKRKHQTGEPLDTKEGVGFRYCSRKPSRPDKTPLIRQMAGLQVVGAAVTPENAASAYEQVVRVELLVKEARKRLETYVDENGPIDLGNGRMFGRYVRDGNEKLDGSVAVKAIAAVVGESAKEFESVAVERKTTKVAIERAAKQLNCKRGTATAVVKKIRELGGASYGADSMPLGEYRRDSKEPAPTLDAGQINKLLEEAG